ncbi:MAG: dTDP-4-dehydrorhamnose reductase [Pseudomonadota bacterium]
MTLLVFGQTGQVARALAGAAGDRSLLSLGRTEADLTNPDNCAAQILHHRPHAVINAAAYTAVDRAEEEEALAHQINAAAPGAMARACADLDIPFLHVSTDYVFAGDGQGAWPPDAPLAPQNAYGRSKLAGEEAVRAAGGQHAILRTAWVFSADGANFVKTMLRLSETRDALSIVGDQRGGPTPARGIAEALLTMADTLADDRTLSGTWHYAGQPTTTWARFARETFALADRKVTVTDIKTQDYPTPAKRPLNSELDCTTLTRDFGIAPPDWRVDLAHVVKEILP